MPIRYAVTPALATSERPGLDHDPHSLAEDLGDATHLDVDVLGDRGRLVLGGVGDPEPAADVDHLAPLAGQLAERADRQRVGLELEDLGADVGVEPDQLELLGGEDALDRLRREAVLEAESELRVQLPGLHVVVGRGLDPRGDPDQHPLGTVEQPLAALDLVERIEDQIADAGARGEQDFLVGLVVAVHVDAARARSRPATPCAARRRRRRRPRCPPRRRPVRGGAGQRLAGEEDLEVGGVGLERLAILGDAGADVVARRRGRRGCPARPRGRLRRSRRSRDARARLPGCPPDRPPTARSAPRRGIPPVLAPPSDRHSDG